MALFLLKALVSGLLVALVSTIAQRSPLWGGLLASLPLVSILAMLWLYGETGDSGRVAALASTTFWFILPSLPMFLIIPAALRSGLPFAATMAVAIATTLILYAALFRWGAKWGLPL